MLAAITALPQIRPATPGIWDDRQLKQCATPVASLNTRLGHPFGLDLTAEDNAVLLASLRQL
jgi:hypothetical protein